MSDPRTARGTLYRSWIVANSLAELAGLGLTFAAGFLILRSLEDPSTPGGWVMLLAAVAASGVVEGAIVGLAQWQVLRRKLEITRRAWVGSTIAGAILAWLLGSLPSTLMQAGAEASSSTMAEPSQWLVLLMASILGLVAGVVLASAQALVLRRSVRKPGLWLPANSLAWAVGMPVIFVAIDLAGGTGSPVFSAALMVAGLAGAGAAVGSIHGLVLVRLEPLPRPESGSHPTSGRG